MLTFNIKVLVISHASRSPNAQAPVVQAIGKEDSTRSEETVERENNGWLTND